MRHAQSPKPSLLIAAFRTCGLFQGGSMSFQKIGMLWDIFVAFGKVGVLAYGGVLP